MSKANGQTNGFNSVFSSADKRASLTDLAGHVRDGDLVAIGGGLSSREPMAVLHELIRAGRKNLTVFGSAHGIDIDLLCGAGAVSRSAESYVGFEQDFGMAPNYRRTCEAGDVVVDDTCCYTMVQQLRATIQGVPFMPIRSARGTDFIKLHPEYKTMTCPFTGEELLLVPAIEPDVAIIHAQYGDAHGNLRIEGPPVADILFAKASRKVIATVEKIVSNEELKELGGVSIPYFYVTALSEVAMGAHPTACYPFYAYDRAHTSLYFDAARKDADNFRQNYLEPYVLNVASHDDYLSRIGGDEVLNRLSSWDRNDASWQALYQEPA